MVFLWGCKYRKTEIGIPQKIYADRPRLVALCASAYEMRSPDRLSSSRQQLYFFVFPWHSSVRACISVYLYVVRENIRFDKNYAFHCSQIVMSRRVGGRELIGQGEGRSQMLSDGH